MTPVGRTTVTLIFPWASSRNDSESTRTAAFVALYTAEPAVPVLP